MDVASRTQRGIRLFDGKIVSDEKITPGDKVLSEKKPN
jgi:hypothetical protein